MTDKRSIFESLIQAVRRLLRSFLAAVTFYTIIGVPEHWPLDYQRIARWTPLMGLLIGSLLVGADSILAQLGMPQITRSALIIALWVFLTGGLHLDGAIDSADGLAVLDPQRRLTVMQDSVTGAFGVMAGVIILLLKTAALSDLSSCRWVGLMMAPAWARWGQVAAIAFYPYLKPTGKGAFHKEYFHFPEDLLLGLFFLGGLSSILGLMEGMKWIAVGGSLGGIGIALLTGFWFYRRLGGHTGDTYGAVVEWTETLLLCWFVLLS